MWTCLQSVCALSSDPVVCILSGLHQSKIAEYALDSAPVSPHSQWAKSSSLEILLPVYSKE